MFNYISYRKTTRSGRYKLRKRTEKMVEMIRTFKNEDNLAILDVGAADGSMLKSFKDTLNTSLCIGIEPSSEFIKSKEGDCAIIQAVGEKLPFRNRVFDVITVASVLDHMQNPAAFLKECQRVLKKSGIVVISLVSSLYDTLAVKFKIKEDDHLYHFKEKDLRELLQKEKFEVLHSSRFALPFFGIVCEQCIERLLRGIGMSWLMFYLVAVGRVNE